MALLKIFTNKAECLYKTARPVENFDMRLSTLIDDMAETMYNAQGVGLAAPQVGVLRRIVVIDVGDGLIEMVNPQIVSFCGEQGDMEGCLSFPEKSGYVVRPQTVVARAFDRHGELHEYRAQDFFARAVMHETDHLDGKIYLRLVTEPPEGFESQQNNKDKR